MKLLVGWKILKFLDNLYHYDFLFTASSNQTITQRDRWGDYHGTVGEIHEKLLSVWLYHAHAWRISGYYQAWDKRLHQSQRGINEEAISALPIIKKSINQMKYYKWFLWLTFIIIKLNCYIYFIIRDSGAYGINFYLTLQFHVSFLSVWRFGFIFVIHRFTCTV